MVGVLISVIIGGIALRIPKIHMQESFQIKEQRDKEWNKFIEMTDVDTTKLFAMALSEIELRLVQHRKNDLKLLAMMAIILASCGILISSVHSFISIERNYILLQGIKELQKETKDA